MAGNQYYVLENEHNGEGWFLPLGELAMYKSEAEEFILNQHYAYLAYVAELGAKHKEPTFKLVSVTGYNNEKICSKSKTILNNDGSITVFSNDGLYSVDYAYNENESIYSDTWDNEFE